MIKSQGIDDKDEGKHPLPLPPLAQRQVMIGGVMVVVVIMMIMMRVMMMLRKRRIVMMMILMVWWRASNPHLPPNSRGVMVSMSAFLACHQCYCAGSSLAWGLNFWAVVCGIF